MNKKGLSFAEIIMAVLILAILAAGVLSAFVASERFLNRAKRRIQAFNFAREGMDRLRSNYGYNDPQMSVGSGHTESEIGTVIRGAMEVVTFNTQLTYDVSEEPTGGYKEVSVSVTWTEPTL